MTELARTVKRSLIKECVYQRTLIREIHDLLDMCLEGFQALRF